MRRIRYRVAMSLDGFIAGPNGDTDWIAPDPDVSFATVYAGFDGVLLGRRTYELTQRPGAPPWPAGWEIFVVSRTLQPNDNPSVHIISDDVQSAVSRLRATPGRDLWLFGGGALAATLLEMALIDVVEVAIMPVVLGAGVPLIARVAQYAALRLMRMARTSNGIVNLQYDVLHAAG